MNKKNLIMAALAAVVLLIVGNRLLFSPEPTPAGVEVQMLELPTDLPARNSQEQLDNTLSALDQLSEAYNLTPEQQAEVRRIIESANNLP